MTPAPGFAGGTRAAPYLALCRWPVLLAVGRGGVLLASVVLVDDADEPRLRAAVERVVALYDPSRTGVSA